MRHAASGRQRGKRGGDSIAAGAPCDRGLGALLALMETLADYGAASYFGLQTFTTSIYRAWFSLGDPLAASQLAAVLLLLVLILFFIEHRVRGRARFFTPTASQRPAARF